MTLGSLVSTDWLAGELGAPDLRIIDTSWFLPADGRDARAEHEAEHIPGAVFLDLDAVSDPGHPAPHMVPSEALFASRMRALGLGDGQRVVVYDNSPLHSAARAWWMLKQFGARHVAVLDGGLAKWKAEGRPLESGAAQLRSGHFTPYSAISNVTGSPAIALPLYTYDDGLPLAVQLIGRPAQEGALLALAAQIEAAAPWAGRHAPLAAT